MWRSLQRWNITNHVKEVTGKEHYKLCQRIYRDVTVPIMSRNLQGRNISSLKGITFSVFNGRR